MGDYEGVTIAPQVFAPDTSYAAFVAQIEPDISTSPEALLRAMESGPAHLPKYPVVAYQSGPTADMIRDAKQISAELSKAERVYREKYNLNPNSWRHAFDPRIIAQQLHDHHVSQVRAAASKTKISLDEVLDHQLGPNWRAERPADGIRLMVMLGVYPPDVAKRMMLPHTLSATSEQCAKLGRHLRKAHPNSIGETNQSPHHKESASNFIKKLSLVLQISPNLPIGMIALDMALNLLPNSNWPIHQALARFTESFFAPPDTLPLAALTTLYLLWTTLATVRLCDKATSAIHEFSPKFRFTTTVITAITIFGVLALFGPPEGGKTLASLLATSPRQHQEQTISPRSDFQDAHQEQVLPRKKLSTLPHPDSGNVWNCRNANKENPDAFEYSDSFCVQVKNTGSK